MSKSPRLPDEVRQAVLAALPSKILTRDDLQRAVSPDTLARWNLDFTISTNSLVAYLEKRGDLKTVKFDFPDRNVYRYLRTDCSKFEVVQSLKPEGYFSHHSAIYLLGLTEQVPKTIYLNFEQHLRAGGGTLSQAGINRAFKGKCRVTNNTAEFGQNHVTLLNGANTGQLGVIEITTSDDAKLRTTCCERTLIDAAVRPIYSGGVFEVSRAYAAASAALSVPKLVKFLRELNFTYPYHQVIGYYLERTGKYKSSDIALFDQFQKEFDFYLDYGMRQTEYNARWRLFIPKGF